MKKILIADDSRVQVHQISQWLTEKGFHVVASFDALQAWMTALREAPDAIILDISMPGGSGIDVLKKLSFSPKTQHIPVIVVSASQELSLEQEAKQLGAIEFLHKPVDRDKLLSGLARLAEQRDT